MLKGTEAVTEFINDVKDGKLDFAHIALELESRKFTDADVARLMSFISQHKIPSIWCSILFDKAKSLASILGCQLPSVFDGFYSRPFCENISIIDLSKNCLTVAPDLTKFVNLTYLNLDYNKIKTPPNITKCTKLRFLSIEGNNLVTIPDQSKCAEIETYIKYSALTPVAKKAIVILKKIRPNSIGNGSLEPPYNLPITIELLDSHFQAIIESNRRNYRNQYKKITYNTALAFKGLTLGKNTDLLDVMPIVISYLLPSTYQSSPAAAKQEAVTLENIFKHDPAIAPLWRAYAKSIVPDDQGIIKNEIIYAAQKSHDESVYNITEKTVAVVDRANYRRMNM